MKCGVKTVKTDVNRKKQKNNSEKEYVTINIGKKGLTESLINEINLQLEKRGIVKVKMLRSFRVNEDRRELAKLIESKINGKVIDLRGFVLTIKKGGV